MDENQIRRIIKEVLMQMAREASTGISGGNQTLPKAYLIFPKDWRSYDMNEYMPAIRSWQSRYDCVTVLPDADTHNTSPLGGSAGTAVGYDSLPAPEAGSTTFFPLPSRDLVVKTALCLSDDFESCWVRKCIEAGLPVYMQKEKQMFTGAEPQAYQRKVLAYYRDAQSYGIRFEETGDISTGITCSRQQTQAAAVQNARYITMSDLRDIPANGQFEMGKDDKLTDLAQEYAASNDIRIITL